MLPARRARPRRRAGLGHLRSAASLRRQQYVGSGDIATPRCRAGGRPDPQHPLPPHAASLAASVRINASADAAVLLWEPSLRAACPGALLGYRVCHAAEGDNVTCEWWHRCQEGGGDRGRAALSAAAHAVSLTDGDVDASASRYALRDLKPGTAYRVGIQEVAAGGGGSCSARWHFQTTALGNGGGPPPFLMGTFLCPIGHRDTGPGCHHHPEVLISRWSGVELQPEVPGHLAGDPSCRPHLPAEQEEVRTGRMTVPPCPSPPALTPLPSPQAPRDALPSPAQTYRQRSPPVLSQ